MAIADALSRALRSEARGRGSSKFAINVELCRSILRRLQRQTSLAASSEASAWIHVCGDLLRDMSAAFDSWQQGGWSEAVFSGSKMLLAAEHKSSCLGAHLSILRDVLSKQSQRSDEGLSTLCRASHVVADDDGRKWWEKSFGQDSYRVPWQVFAASLGEIVTANQGDSELCGDEACWRTALLGECEGDSEVTAHVWGCFLFDFGPTPLRALREWAVVSRCCWYAGVMSENEARALLEGAAPGAFLVYRRRSKAAPNAGERSNGSTAHSSLASAPRPPCAMGLTWATSGGLKNAMLLRRRATHASVAERPSIGDSTLTVVSSDADGGGAGGNSSFAYALWQRSEGHGVLAPRAWCGSIFALLESYRASVYCSARHRCENQSSEIS